MALDTDKIDKAVLALLVCILSRTERAKEVRAVDPCHLTKRPRLTAAQGVSSPSEHLVGRAPYDRPTARLTESNGRSLCQNRYTLRFRVSDPAQLLSRGSAPNGMLLPGLSPRRGISIAVLRLRVGVLRPAHGAPAGFSAPAGRPASLRALDFAAMLLVLWP